MTRTFYLLLGLLSVVLIALALVPAPPCDPTTETLWCGSELTREVGQ